MTIKIPGKIFIAGEYAALKGMPALTVAVQPSFRFIPSKNSSSIFHPQSPAGLLDNSIGGNFFDPYCGVGGMGASTAEFLAVASVKMDLSQYWNIWKSYRTLLARQENTPSGVDLLTQLTGGYCITETAAEILEQKNWPFKNLKWIAIITGNKVRTHEHLRKPLELDWMLVEKLNRQIVNEFKFGNEKQFVSALTEWRQFLFKNKLEVAESTELIEFFNEIPGVVTAKGCGALGSDVVFVLYESANATYLEKSLEYWDENQIVKSSQVSSDGLTITDENENFSSL